VLERKAARKRIAIRSLPSGGTFEQQVPLAQMNALCLEDAQLAALGELALQCEKAYGPRHDIEWAFQDKKLYLLQCLLSSVQEVAARKSGSQPCAISSALGRP
jgi:phosphoenolpyruvate synthase/pyruvate phosphate dikinase